MREPAHSEVISGLSEAELLRIQALSHLHSTWKPKPGQLMLGRALFETGVKVVFLRYGRSGGKTYGAYGCCCKMAIETDKLRIYYYAPLLKQAREIVWAPRLWEDFVPPEFIQSIDKADMRITLINGSFIKLDGSDNIEAVRGVKPDVVVADEFAEFDKRWLDRMTPNLGPRNATIMLLGTPPEFPINHDGSKHHYVVLDEESRWRAKKYPKRVFWGRLRTVDANPQMVDYVAEQKEILYARGEGYVYEREYEAKIVAGDSRQIFPMFSEDEHMLPHDELMEFIHEDPERYEFWIAADPATRSTFAVVFMALDRYTATPFWLDELYVTDQSETVARIMNKRIYEKCEDLGIPFDVWNTVCDNAAASYMEESLDPGIDHPVVWSPTVKELGDKGMGISLMKSVFLYRRHVMSDRCEHTGREIMLYLTDQHGRIIKLRDHTIDASRYILKSASFEFDERPGPARRRDEDPEEKNYMVPADRAWARRVSEGDLIGEILDSYGETI